MSARPALRPSHAAAPLALLFLAAAASPSLAQERLPNPDAAAADRFGAALSVSGPWLLVGAPSDDAPGVAGAGTATVFERQAGAYVEVAQLYASGGASGDGFGQAVAIEGAIAVVGAPEDNTPSGSGAGSVTVFTHVDGNWVELQTLQAPDGATGDAFGSALALAGDLLVVGAPFDDHPSLVNAGSAHVYRREGDAFVHVAKLLAADVSDNDAFGGAVALGAGNLLVGAREANGGGAVYAFEVDGLAIDYVGELDPPERGPFDRFGTALALDGATALVGAPGTPVEGAGTPGAAYVFTREAGGWTAQARLVSPAAADGAMTGASVALLGSLALLGSPEATLGPCCQQGAVELFLRAPGSDPRAWRFTRRLLAADAATFDGLGRALALEPAAALAGAPDANAPDQGPLDAGSVVRFDADWPLFRDGFEASP